MKKNPDLLTNVPFYTTKKGIGNAMYRLRREIHKDLGFEIIPIGFAEKSTRKSEKKI